MPRKTGGFFFFFFFFFLLKKVSAKSITLTTICLIEKPTALSTVTACSTRWLSLSARKEWKKYFDGSASYREYYGRHTSTILPILRITIDRLKGSTSHRHELTTQGVGSFFFLMKNHQVLDSTISPQVTYSIYLTQTTFVSNSIHQTPQKKNMVTVPITGITGDCPHYPLPSMWVCAICTGVCAF